MIWCVTCSKLNLKLHCGSVFSRVFVLLSAERKQTNNLTPDGAPLITDVTSCNESPFVEGCSPIRSCSPHRLHHQNEPQHTCRPRSKPRTRVRCWASPPLISPILNPNLHDNHEVEECPPATTTSSCLPSMELDPSSPLAQDAHPAAAERISLDHVESVKMEEGKGIERRLEHEEEEEESGESSGHLTSSRMGNASATESSQMFVSLLAEGSSIRCDSSMQVSVENYTATQLTPFFIYAVLFMHMYALFFYALHF